MDVSESSKLRVSTVFRLHRGQQLIYLDFARQGLALHSKSSFWRRGLFHGSAGCLQDLRGSGSLGSVQLSGASYGLEPKLLVSPLVTHTMLPVKSPKGVFTIVHMSYNLNSLNGVI